MPSAMPEEVPGQATTFADPSLAVAVKCQELERLGGEKIKVTNFCKCSQVKSKCSSRRSGGGVSRFPLSCIISFNAITPLKMYVGAPVYR